MPGHGARVSKLARDGPVDADWCRQAVVGKARVLRPDARVDDADRDALSGDAELVGARRAAEAEEVAAFVGVCLHQLVRKHHRNVLVRGEINCLLVVDERRESVQGGRVRVDDPRRRYSRIAHRLCVACLQLLATVLCLRRVEAIRSLGYDEGLCLHDHDVAVVLTPLHSGRIRCRLRAGSRPKCQGHRQRGKNHD